jgi:glycosyltransferase involved in cell wall biosynthesis/peptidoglycan/xylan/chitin deacetylase (PgdA/CDA1 family)
VVEETMVMNPAPVDRDFDTDFPVISRRQPSGKRIRILQLGATLVMGGSEKCFATIAEGLDPARFHTVFAGLGPDGGMGEILRARGDVAEAFLRRDGIDPSLVWRIMRFLDRHPVDIIQTHHMGPLIYAGPIAWWRGIRVVHTEHDIHNFHHRPSNLKWLHRLRWLADAFIGIDPAISEFLIREGGVPERKVHTIRNGVDMSRFQPSNRIRRKGDPFTLGTVCRMDRPKRPELLLEATARLRAEGRDVRALLVGAGALMPELTALAERLGITNQVEFAGMQADVPAWLARMDGYVLASDMEGLPISVIEAMAAAKPVIASAVGGIPAVIQQKVNGMLLERNHPDELTDQVRTLLDREDGGAELGRLARGTVEASYSAAATVRQYAELFERVVAGSSAHSAPVTASFPPIARTEPSVDPNQVIAKAIREATRTSNGGASGAMPGTLRRIASRLIHATGIPALARRHHRHELTIINYHGVYERPPALPPSWVMVSSRRFAEQMTWARSRYRFIPLSAAIDRLRSGEGFETPTACVTFDDGYRNNATVARPILEQLGIPATVFLAVGLMGRMTPHWTLTLEQMLLASAGRPLDLSRFGQPRISAIPARPGELHIALKFWLYRLADEHRDAVLDEIRHQVGFNPSAHDWRDFEIMTFDEARSLAAGGLFEFGGHTFQHRVTSALGDAEARHEILGSNDAVRMELNVAPVAFAFPNGTPSDISARDRALLAEADLAGCTSTDGLNHPAAGVLNLRRFSVGNTTSIRELSRHTSGMVSDCRAPYHGLFKA